MSNYDFTAVGFLVIDVLCRYATEMPPPGGATFVDEATMTVAGTAVKSLLRLTSFRRNTHNKIKTISPSPGVIIGSDFT